MEQDKRFSIALLLLLVFTSLAFQNAFGIVGDEAISADREFTEHKVVYKKEAPKIPVKLKAADFDPLGQKKKARNRELYIESYLPEEEGYYIIQFKGPVKEGWKRQVQKLGAELHSYVPKYAFVVEMDGRTREEIEKLNFVRWVGIYHPTYKIDPALQREDSEHWYAYKEDKSSEKVNITVLLFKGKNTRAILKELRRLDGEVVAESGRTVRARIDSSKIKELAMMPEVEWIEEYHQPQLLNDVSRWVIQSYENGSTPIWDYGITGEGQIVGVADTGIDIDSCYFSTDPNKIANYTDWAGNGDYDAHGHGTHVSGTIAGDKGTVDAYDTYDGMAFSAQVVMQDIGWGGLLFGIPSDLNDLFQGAYDAGARIHSNSWGSNVGGVYTISSQQTDEFMWNNSDFLILFANGNSGPGSNTVGSPATAKNVVSVGATENGANAENMASFSSHGATEDGRIKPTVSAPGVDIVSARSDYDISTNNCDTRPMSGTSMATPTTAGAAALIRQYFVDGYYPSGTLISGNSLTPSGALLKAMLINSAKNMSGDYTDGPIPSNGQGWGRILLDDVLYFLGDSRGLKIYDNITGLNTGQDVSYQVTVSNSSEQLEVTLVWTDYPSTPAAGGPLVNDLNLIVSGPGGTYLGNVFSGRESITGGTADDINVEEQVLVGTPSLGTYTVKINGSNIPQGPQPFALVITGGIGVSGKGIVALNGSVYSCSGTVGITLVDADLNVDNTTVENATVNIKSYTEIDPEIVNLTETGNNTAIFTGSIGLSTVDSLGTLNVTHNDIINATYYDDDNGTGSSAIAYDTATIDCIPPEITINLPQNIIYNTSDVDFDINSSEALDATAGVLVFNTDTNAGLPFIPLVGDSSTHWYNSTVPYFENDHYNATFQVKDLVGNPNSSTVWFRVAGPDINVTPLEINETLIQGNATERNVTIGNDGLSELELNVTVQTAFFDDMESGVNKWTNESLWHQEVNRSNSPTTSWAYNTGPPDYNYDVGDSWGALTSPVIDLSVCNSANLTFKYLYETESSGTAWDRRWIQIGVGGVFTNLAQLSGDTMLAWNEYSLDLSSYTGNSSVQVRFFFDTIDSILNDFEGWYIDDVSVICAGGWLSTTTTNGTVAVSNETNVTVTINATGLNNGAHTGKVYIYSNDLDETPTLVPINLNVIDITPPIVTISSPANGTTYNLSWVGLNYSVNEDTLVVNYTLDANTGEAIVIFGNTTIKNLTNGQHNLTVNAQDLGGNWNSSTVVYFNVTAPKISISPSEINLTLYEGNKTERNITIGNDGLSVLEFNVSSGGGTGGGSGPRIGIVQEGGYSNYETLLTNLGYSWINVSASVNASWLLDNVDILIQDGSGSFIIDSDQILEYQTFYDQGGTLWISYDDVSTSSFETEMCALTGASDFAEEPDYSTITFIKATYSNGEPTNVNGLTLDFGQGDQEVITPNTCVVLDNYNESTILDGGSKFVMYLGDTISSVYDLSATGTLGLLFDGFVDMWEIKNTDFLTVTPTNGTVDTGNHTNVTVIINSTGLKNGTHSAKIRIDSTDLDKNPSNVTVNLNVIDITPPKLSFASPTPSNGASLSSSTSSVTISVSVEEVGPDTLILNWNGDNESHTYSNGSNTITKSVSSGSSYTFYVWANDTAGNSNQTSTISFSVQSGGGGSGPGGGGGGGRTVADFEMIIREIKKGESFTVLISDSHIPYLRGITITAAQDTHFAKLSITDLEKGPYVGGDPDGSVYRYFTIKYSKPDNYIEKASLKFGIKKLWLDAEDIDPFTIKLYRYTRGWDTLDTETTEEDKDWIYLQAETPGFSYFSMGGKEGTGYRPLVEPTEIGSKLEGFAGFPKTVTPTPKETEPPRTPSPIVEKTAEGKRGICGPTFILIIAVLSAMFLGRRVHRKV